MEELIKILQEIKPGVDFETEENLIEGEVLDSFEKVLQLAVNKKYLFKQIAWSLASDFAWVLSWKDWIKPEDLETRPYLNELVKYALQLRWIWYTDKWSDLLWVIKEYKTNQEQKWLEQEVPTEEIIKTSKASTVIK